jgi:hypothetical protein
MVFEDPDMRAAAVLGSQFLGQLDFRMPPIVMVNEPADKPDHDCRIRSNTGSDWPRPVGGIGRSAKDGNSKCKDEDGNVWF